MMIVKSLLVLIVVFIGIIGGLFILQNGQRGTQQVELLTKGNEKSGEVQSTVVQQTSTQEDNGVKERISRLNYIIMTSETENEALEEVLVSFGVTLQPKKIGVSESLNSKEKLLEEKNRQLNNDQIKLFSSISDFVKKDMIIDMLKKMSPDDEIDLGMENECSIKILAYLNYTKFASGEDGADFLDAYGDWWNSINPTETVNFNRITAKQMIEFISSEQASLLRESMREFRDTLLSIV